MIKGLDNNYHSVALTSQLYDVVGVYPGMGHGPDITQMPTYVSITVKATPYRELNSRTVTIKGELAHQFTRELIELRTYLKDNGGPLKEHHWHECMIYPFLYEWVVRMDAIKLALKTMDVTRQGNTQTFAEWMDETATANVNQRRQS